MVWTKFLQFNEQLQFNEWKKKIDDKILNATRERESEFINSNISHGKLIIISIVQMIVCTCSFGRSVNRVWKQLMNYIISLELYFKRSIWNVQSIISYAASDDEKTSEKKQTNFPSCWFGRRKCEHVAFVVVVAAIFNGWCVLKTLFAICNAKKLFLTNDLSKAKWSKRNG